jgi:hypothetical protein
VEQGQAGIADSQNLQLTNWQNRNKLLWRWRLRFELVSTDRLPLGEERWLHCRPGFLMDYAGFGSATDAALVGNLPLNSG